jgi:hypothetical protein
LKEETAKHLSTEQIRSILRTGAQQQGKEANKKVKLKKK